MRKLLKHGIILLIFEIMPPHGGGPDKGDDYMATFTVNGQSVTVEKNQKLIHFLRDTSRT